MKLLAAIVLVLVGIFGIQFYRSQRQTQSGFTVTYNHFSDGQLVETFTHAVKASGEWLEVHQLSTGATKQVAGTAKYGVVAVKPDKLIRMSGFSGEIPTEQQLKAKDFVETTRFLGYRVIVTKSCPTPETCQTLWRAPQLRGAILKALRSDDEVVATGVVKGEPEFTVPDLPVEQRPKP